MTQDHVVTWLDRSQSDENPSPATTPIAQASIETTRAVDDHPGSRAASLVVKAEAATRAHWLKIVGRRSVVVDIVEPEAWRGRYSVVVLLGGTNTDGSLRVSTSARRIGDAVAPDEAIEEFHGPILLAAE